MGYSPTTYTDTLTMRLGHVKTNCAMTNGSAAFTATGLGLLAADVGVPAMVFGAGPAGAPIITTVATRVSGNAGTLAIAASTDVTDVTIIIFRAVSCRKDSIKFNTSLTARGTASFTVLSSVATPRAGMPVLLQDSTYGDLFGGSIEQVRRVREPGTGKTWQECSCISYDQLASKRTTGSLTAAVSSPPAASPLNGSFVDYPAGDLVAYLVAHALNGDGMGSVTISGPNINLGTQYEYCDQAFDRICQVASNDVDKYWWNTSPWRVVHFAKQSTTAAPWQIDEGAGSDGNVLALVANTETRQKYANIGINSLTGAIADADTESYSGDGSATEFGLTRNVAAAPTVQVDGVDQTVGILNVDTGKDWYYAVGSNLITQDSGGTPLTSGQTIAVTYQGYITAIVRYQNSAAVDERSGVEGGTGYYESVFESSTPMTSSDGLALAQAVATNYGEIPQRVEIATYRGGLEAGQYITIVLSDIGVSGTFLIDSVTLTTANNRKLWTVTAIDGALIGDWRTMLGSRSGGKGIGTGSAAGGTGSGGTSAPADTTLTISTDTTLSAGPQIVAIDSTSANVTATLPSAATMIGQQVKLKKTVAAHQAIIEGAGSETIDGSLNYTLNDQWEGIIVESVSATEWRIVANSVALSASAPTAPGVFTLGTLSYQWLTHEVLGNKSKRATVAGLLRVFIPVTPPVSMGVTQGAHLYLENPDISSSPTARMDGVTDMSGSFVMQDDWAPQDLGKLAYVATEQPWYVDLDVEVTDTTILRIYAPSYSDAIDTPLVQAGQPGASPSALLTVSPFTPGKPASGSNRTTLLVTGVTVTKVPAELHNGKLYRPISVTVDLSGLPAVRPTNWRYQLVGYRDDDLNSSPVLISGLYNLDGLAGAGPDDITIPHTFGPDEPSEVINVSIYAVAGTVGTPHRDVIEGREQQPTWSPNNIVPGVTASAVISYGTTAGVIDGGAMQAATIRGGSIASATITGTNIASATISGGNIASATITGSNIGSATIAGSNIAAATIAGSNIGSATITGTNVASATITGTNIAASTVAGSNIGASTIAGSNIAASTVSGANIASATVTGANIDNLTISAANITNLTIDGTKIAASTLTGGKIASGTITGGNLVNQTITATQLATGTITATEIANATITGGKIANATITGSNLANGTITATQIQSATITATQIASGTITATQIQSATITATQIASATITANEIANLTITGGKIANATIGSAKITDLDVSKLNAGTISVAVSLTAPTIQITSGAVVVNMDGSNYVKVANSGAHIYTQLQYDRTLVQDSSNANVFAQLQLSQLELRQSTTFKITVDAGAVALTNGSSTATLNAGALFLNGSQVLSGRQTDPGAPSFASVSDAQTWCSNLRNSLRSHGLI